MPTRGTIIKRFYVLCLLVIFVAATVFLSPAPSASAPRLDSLKLNQDSLIIEEPTSPKVVAKKKILKKKKVTKKKVAARKTHVSRSKVRYHASAEKNHSSRSDKSCSLLNESACGKNQRIGKGLAADRGWTGRQWVCLKRLWYRESGWSTRSSNSSGTAWGIPQALPGSKMAKFGSDWRTNPVTQIKWGLHYIDNRYGSPCAAWAHSESHNWY